MERIKAVQRELESSLEERTELLAGVFKWLLIAAVTGAAVGALAALFLKALEAASSATHGVPYYFLLLPVALVINVVFLRYVWPDAPGPSTDTVIRHVHAREPISLKSIPKAFLAPILTIASGGSAGKEAPAADMGASIGAAIGRLLRFGPNEMRKLAICGISAGFAAVFGTPIAGALFGLEVLFVGSLLYDVLLPAFIAGVTGYAVAAALGAPYFYQDIAVSPVFSNQLFFSVILAGVFFGLVAVLLIALLRLAARFAASFSWRTVVAAFFGGVLIVFLALLTSPIYLGLGLETIEQSVAGEPAPPAAFVLKAAFTGLTLSFGGSGGLVTPTLFVGATAGSSFAQLFHLDLATFAAIGAVAVLGAATNAPIAASVLAIELFGSAIGPYAAVAVIVAFFITGHRSIYPSQVTRIHKAAAVKVSFPDVPLLRRIKEKWTGYWELDLRKKK